MFQEATVSSTCFESYFIELYVTIIIYFLTDSRRRALNVLVVLLLLSLLLLSLLLLLLLLWLLLLYYCYYSRFLHLSKWIRILVKTGHTTLHSTEPSHVDQSYVSLCWYFNNYSVKSISHTTSWFVMQNWCVIRFRCSISLNKTCLPDRPYWNALLIGSIPWFRSTVIWWRTSSSGWCCLSGASEGVVCGRRTSDHPVCDGAVCHWLQSSLHHRW